MTTDPTTPPPFDVGAFSRAMPGQTACGDRVLVRHDGVRLCIAVMDGLGHGPLAAAATSQAAAFLQERSWADLPALMRGCHAALRGSRGAAVALLSVDTESLVLSHAGLGNVATMASSRRPIRPISRPGIAGVRAARIVVETFTLSPGDVLVTFTDGVSSRMDVDALPPGSAQSRAEQIVRDFGKPHDDAACAVVVHRHQPSKRVAHSGTSTDRSQGESKK